MTLEQQLDREREVTGCFLSESPFVPFQSQIDQTCNTTVGSVAADEWPESGRGRFVALLSRINVIVCKRGKSAGKEMAFATFIGVDGESEATIFPADWEAETANPHHIERGKVYLVDASRDRDRSGVIVRSMHRLSTTPPQ